MSGLNRDAVSSSWGDQHERRAISQGKHYKVNNMSQNQHESIIVESLYQSALRADYWSVALGQLCNACSAEAGRLLMMDTTTALVSFSIQVGIPFDTGHSGEVMVHCIPMTNGPEQVDLPRTYNWFFLKPAGQTNEAWNKTLIHDLSLRLRAVCDETRFALLILQTTPAYSGDFAWVDSGLIHLLRFHVRLAVLLFAKNNQNLINRQLELAALNRLNIGVAYMTRRGTATYCNPFLAAILEGRDGLYLRDTGFSTHAEDPCNLFRDIAESALTDNISGIRIVDRPSGQSGYQLCYMPVSDSVHDVTGEAVYLLLVFDPETRSESLAEFMELGYNLSKTEAKVVTHICRGIPAEEYAAQENVSVATARTQLRSIYKRTKTDGQIKLTNLVRGLEFLKPPEKMEKKPKSKPRRRRNAFDLSALMASIDTSRNPPH